jgi:membrane-bound lytic murein transglycosylase F
LKRIAKYCYVVLLFLLTTCNSNKDNSARVHIDLSEIKQRGRLIAITNANTIDYFIYRGQPMGFQYELLQNFAEYSGLQLEIIASNDVDDILTKLTKGKCDIVAVNMQVTKDKKELVAFTSPIMQSRQVLVQRKTENWQSLPATDVSKALVKNPLELEGKTVIVQKNTAYAERLHNILDETGVHMTIIEAPEDAEQLIEYVAKGDIDYTVCDERIAQVNLKYYPQLDVSTAISFPQNISWAVRKSSENLLVQLNLWLEQYKNTSSYAILYNKYYKNQWASYMVNSDYFVLNTGRISPYDEEIKKFSKLINWDWRLLASLIYHESKFNPNVKSWAGAYGLMQIMPSTAERYGIDSSASPSANMAAGVKLLKWLDQRFSQEIVDENERVKFVLASYNIGVGHVIDAQNLARKYYRNPFVWDDVEYFLLSKSNPKYYKDPIVQFGYCKGVETSNYVSDVISLYNHYKNITKVE